MPRYIDADKLKSFIKANGYLYANTLDEFLTADVAPVVRCKDCKWWNRIGCAIQIVSDSDKPKADDFCSFGERKDDEILHKTAPEQSGA